MVTKPHHSRKKQPIKPPEIADTTPVESEEDIHPALRGAPRLSPTSSIWKLVGQAVTTGPTDVSTNKHKYLADIYAAEADK